MATGNSNSTARRRGPNPTGRLDLCAIRLLEHAVGAYGDIPLRGIYGTYKPEIDRAIKRHLGKVRIYVPEPVRQLMQAPTMVKGAPPPSPPPRKPRTPPTTGTKAAITMDRNKDGVYEVSNA